MFSERLQQARIKAGLKQSDIAQEIGLTTSAYGYYEQGKREPNFETLQRICSILNVSSDYLLNIHNIENVKIPSDKLSWEEVSNAFPNAFQLSEEEKDIVQYYNQLTKTDRRWIMGQVIDLIKKSDIEENLNIPKAQ